MAIYPELREKVVLITGGANGIGAAMVQAFQQQGALVFFCDVDVPAAEKLLSKAGDLSFMKVNLMKEANIKKWVAHVGKKVRQIDVVINNAASDPRLDFESMTAEQWDGLFARNLRAYFLVCR